jgi:hypothetical protein
MTAALIALAITLASTATASAAPSRATASVTTSGDCRSLTTTVTWSNAPRTAQIAHLIEAYVDGQWRTSAEWDVRTRAAAAGTSTRRWSGPTVSRAYAQLLDRSGKVLLTTPRVTVTPACLGAATITGVSSPSPGTVLVHGQNLRSALQLSVDFAEVRDDNVSGRFYYAGEGFSATDTTITISDPDLSGRTIVRWILWDQATGSVDSGGTGRVLDLGNLTIG